ncbi:MAG TPA: phosphatase PAP2 family protein [Acidimicrobiia bacterium]|nr:phosphatase PAP2 family protein [Acidimicrobiia bacterium]
MSTATDHAPGPPGEPAAPLVAAALVVAASVIVAAVLALLVHHGVGFVRFDRRGLHLVRTHDTPMLVDASRALADLGTLQVLVVLALLAAVALRILRVHPVLCAVPLASLLLTGALVEMTKLAIPRASPNTYFRWGVERGIGSSFPSGHAADATALAVGVAIVVGAVLVHRPAQRVVVGAAAVAVSIAAGVGRLVLGVHWPTDVLAGWAIGLGTAVVVATAGVLATQRSTNAPADRVDARA